MTAKIYDIFTGQELKRPRQPACDRRASAKLTAQRQLSEAEARRRGGEGFTNAGEIALRDILPDLKRRMPR